MNEGLMDKYWRYTTPIGHFGFGSVHVEIRVPALMTPAIALAAPVLISTAAGQETQAFGLTYLIAGAFVTELAGGRAAEHDAGR